MPLNFNAMHCIGDSANAKHCYNIIIFREDADHLIKLISRLEKVLLVMVITNVTSNLEIILIDQVSQNHIQSFVDQFNVCLYPFFYSCCPRDQLLQTVPTQIPIHTGCIWSPSMSTERSTDGTEGHRERPQVLDFYSKSFRLSNRLIKYDISVVL